MPEIFGQENTHIIRILLFPNFFLHKKQESYLLYYNHIIAEIFCIQRIFHIPFEDKNTGGAL